MNIYIQQIILAAAVVYIVDLSGFTESWRALVERWVNRVRSEQEKREGKLVHVHQDLRPLPPFDCGKCMTFWACLIWAVVQGHFGLLTFASSAALSLLSKSFSSLMIFISEAIEAAFDKITPNR
ncbi:MAG: hypothetical protein K6A62_04640 [Bacteroidales bacterium]|nr:hypothetical protein [Bacteroidales bacterium]